MTSKQFCTFPLESELRVEELAVEIRHIGQAVHPGYHCDLSHSIAECAINVGLSETSEE